MDPPVPNGFRIFPDSVMCIRCHRSWHLRGWTNHSREYLLQHDQACWKKQARIKRREYVLDPDYDYLLDRSYTAGFRPKAPRR